MPAGKATKDAMSVCDEGAGVTRGLETDLAVAEIVLCQLVAAVLRQR